MGSRRSLPWNVLVQGGSDTLFVGTLRLATARNKEIVGNTPEAFGAFLRAETVKWAKVAKAVGIKPE